MNLWLDLSRLLNIGGFFLGIFLAISVFRNSGNKKSSTILAILLLVFSAMIFNTILRLSDYADTLARYEDFSNSLILTVGPLLYLFLLRLGGAKGSWRTSWHFAPFTIYWLASLVTFGTEIKDVVDAAVFVGMNAQVLLYFYFSYRLFLKHDQEIRNKYAFTRGVDLRWLRVFVLAFFITYLFNMVMIVLSETVIVIPDEIKLNGVLLLSVSIFLLSGERLKSNESTYSVEIPPREKAALLSTEESKRIVNALNQHMESKKSFLDDSLSLAKLAKELGVSSRSLSQVINNSMKRNFHEYINSLRVEEIKVRMLDPEYSNYTLAGIAMKTGFSSKSAFQDAFKKMTGKTPLAFKKEAQKKS